MRDFVLAIVLVLGFVALVVWVNWPALLSIGIPLVLFAGYCALAFLVRVRPNHEQWNLIGTLDPVAAGNRFLVQVAVALAPGRFVSLGLVDGVRLLRRGKLPQDQFIQDLE